MARQTEHAPGEAVPATGTDEKLDVFGSPTGVQITAAHGEQFPATPRGHSWTPVDDSPFQC